MKPDLDLFQLYETHYFFEISRKDQLNSHVAMPAGIVTLLIGASIAMLSQTEYRADVGTTLLIVCMAFAIVSALGCVFFLVRAYHDYQYRYVSTLAELDAFRLRLHADDVATGIQEADADFAQAVLQKYADCQHHNAQHNDTKAGYLHKATQCLVTTMIGLALAAGPFVWGLTRAVAKVQRVEIVNLSGEDASVQRAPVDVPASSESTPNQEKR